MGTTFGTPEQKAEKLAQIKTGLANKMGIENLDKIDDKVNTALDIATEAEFGRRETQASFTKGQQTISELTGERDYFQDRLQSNLALTVKETNELEDLKYSDPVAWRNKMTELEGTARQEFQASVVEGLSHVKSKVSKEFEEKRVENILEKFSVANPEINLVDKAIREQLPPTMITQLVNGTMTFEDFSVRASALITGTVLGNTKLPGETKDPLGNTRGAQRPGKQEIHKSIIDDYEKLQF